jgi:hypothetical protein
MNAKPGTPNIRQTILSRPDGSWTFLYDGKPRP